MMIKLSQQFEFHEYDFITIPGALASQIISQYGQYTVSIWSETYKKERMLKA